MVVGGIIILIESGKLTEKQNGSTLTLASSIWTSAFFSLLFILFRHKQY